MTTHDPEGLGPELSFEPDGHLTELCLTCLSDGELALVPPEALAHLDACEPCARRLGEAALLSVATGEALRSSPPAAASLALGSPAPGAAAVPAGAAAPRRIRRPLPVVAIAAALLVATLTAGPALLEAARELPRAVSGVVGLLLFAARVGSTLLRASSSGAGPLLVKCVSAVVFVVLGLRVARARSRAGAWQGGVQ